MVEVLYAVADVILIALILVIALLSFIAPIIGFQLGYTLVRKIVDKWNIC